MPILFVEHFKQVKISKSRPLSAISVREAGRVIFVQTVYTMSRLLCTGAQYRQQFDVKLKHKADTNDLESEQ